MENKQNARFVPCPIDKEGNHKGTWKGLPNGAAASLYRDTVSGIRIAFVDFPTPICYLTIIVPTVPVGDKGLPHDLEHMVFLDSRKYPRSFLDKYASRCISGGTNAATTEDHTRYIFSCAGPSGVSTILPVFLEQILNPLLTEDGILTEIYNVAPCSSHDEEEDDEEEEYEDDEEEEEEEEGEDENEDESMEEDENENENESMEEDEDEKCEESGVVFSEIEGRENSEADLCEAAVHALVFPGSGYTKDLGGNTAGIATIERSDLVSYHRQFYTPDAITLLIVGCSNHDDVFKAVAAVDFPAKPSTPAPKAWSEPLPPFTSDATLVRPFPGEDDDEDSAGSVCLAWRGPSFEDPASIVALEVLGRYLEESAASPLNQAFVECNPPAAGYVDFTITYHKEALIELGFGSVKKQGPGLAEGYFKSRVLEILRGYKEAGVVGAHPGYMRGIVRRHKIKFLESVEEEPHDTLTELSLPDFVFPVQGGDFAFFGKLRTYEILDDLETKDDAFWVALLDKWILSRPCAEVILVPSATAAETVEAAARARRQAIAERLGEEGLRAQGERVARAQELAAKGLSDDVLAAFPHMPSPETVPLQTVVGTLEHAGGMLVQHLALDTFFVQARLCVDLNGLPSSLRPFLPLFQELFLSSDVVEGGKVTPYAEVVRSFVNDLVSMVPGIGFDACAFSCSSVAEMFSVWATCVPEKYGPMCAWLARVFHFVRFTEERVLTAATNLQTVLSECIRDGETASTSLGTFALAQQGTPSIDVCIDLFAQRAALKRVIENPASAVAALEAIRVYLASSVSAAIAGSSAESPRVMIQMCAAPEKNSKDLCAEFIDVWKQKEGACPAVVPPQPASEKPVFACVPYIPKPLRAGGRAIVMPVTGIESAYGGQYVECNIPKTHPDYMPLCCVCQLLSQVEGILYKSVRGPGYSYGAGIEYYPFNGYLAFTLLDSTAPEKALAAFIETIRSLFKKKGKRKCAAFDDLCTEAALETTKAIMLYNWYESKSTVPTIATSALKGYFRGFPTPDAEEKHHLRAVQAITRADVKRVFDKYIRDFLAPEKVTTVFVASPSASTRLAEALSQPPLSLKNVRVMKPSEISDSISLQF